MSKFKVKKNDRIAIWQAWDEYCYICNLPIKFFELEIDHVVPEFLVERPEELKAFREECKIDESFPGFQINDFCNFAPAHRHPCNGSKTDYYAPWTFICLEKVRDKRDRVREEQEKLKKTKQQNRALADIEAALERKDITEQDVRELLAARALPPQDRDPVVLTFGLTIEDLFKNPQFKQRGLSYPALCDWLESDLTEYLATIIDTEFEYSEPSSRTGETLSVRVVFPNVDMDRLLSNFSRSWWAILEESTYRTLYDAWYGLEYPPEREIVLHKPVNVTLTPERVDELDQDDARKYATFSVLSYEFTDDTERLRAMAARSQKSLIPRDRMTRDQIEQQHSAVPGGKVTILNGDGEEETLDLTHEYLDLIGIDGEFADVNPVNWEKYALDLSNWYTNAPPDPDEDPGFEYEGEEPEGD